MFYGPNVEIKKLSKNEKISILTRFFNQELAYKETMNLMQKNATSSVMSLVAHDLAEIRYLSALRQTLSVTGFKSKESLLCFVLGQK